MGVDAKTDYYFQLYIQKINLTFLIIVPMHGSYNFKETGIIN